MSNLMCLKNVEKCWSCSKISIFWDYWKKLINFEEKGLKSGFTVCGYVYGYGMRTLKGPWALTDPSQLE